MDLLILIILVAIFFSISLTAAFHGILQFFLTLVGIVIVLIILYYLFKPIDTPAPQPKPTPQPAPKPVAKKKPEEKFKVKHPVLSKIIGWSVFFIISYIITFYICIGTGITWSTEYLRSAEGAWLAFSLPAVPFILTLASSIIKKWTTKKRAKSK